MYGLKSSSGQEVGCRFRSFVRDNRVCDDETRKPDVPGRRDRESRVVRAREQIHRIGIPRLALSSAPKWFGHFPTISRSTRSGFSNATLIRLLDGITKPPLPLDPCLTISVSRHLSSVRRRRQKIYSHSTIPLTSIRSELSSSNFSR